VVVYFINTKHKKALEAFWDKAPIGKVPVKYSTLETRTTK